jgi:hypothetical protein
MSFLSGIMDKLESYEVPISSRIVFVVRYGTDDSGE